MWGGQLMRLKDGISHLPVLVVPSKLGQVHPRLYIEAESACVHAGWDVAVKHHNHAWHAVQGVRLKVICN